MTQEQSKQAKTKTSQGSKDGLNVPASIYRRGSAWCSNCGKDFDLDYIYKVERLYLCEECWTRIVTIFGECFPTLISLNYAIYLE